MANLQKTQAQWTQIFREWGLFLKILKDLDFARKRYQFTRNVVIEEFEEAGKLGTWSLSGVRLNVNTDHQGVLYGKLLDENPGAGQAKVELYTDSARTVKVAEGSAVDGFAITLAAVNNSGLTGSVKIGTIAADDNDWRLVVLQDYYLQPQQVFDNTAPAQAALSDLIVLIEDTGSDLNSLKESIQGDVESDFIETRLREFLNSTNETIISILENDDSGIITITRSGLLVELKDAMEDESVAGAQTVIRNTVASASLSSDPDNVGFGGVVISNIEEYVENGTVILTCTDETIGSETFSVSQRVAGSNQIINAANDLVVARLFRSVDIGVQIVINRSLSETNDAGNQLAGYSFSGETDDNTDNGLLYVNLTDVAGTRTVDVYKDSIRTLKVASGSRVGDGTITLGQVNASGLTGSIVVIFTVDDIDITIHLNPFKIGDEFRFELTNDEAGVIQTVVGRTWKMVLPSVAAGAETIKDGAVSEGLEILTRDHSA